MVPETLPQNQEKKVHFLFTNHCLDLHQRLNETFFCFVLFYQLCVVSPLHTGNHYL